jgi:hypothetical protein
MAAFATSWRRSNDDYSAWRDSPLIALNRSEPCRHNLENHRNLASSHGRKSQTAPSDLTESPSQRHDLANLLSQRPAGGNRLGGVEAMLVVAVAGTLRPAGARGATVHAAAPFPAHGRRSAWSSPAGLSATPRCVAKLPWFVGRVYGVVHDFWASPSLWDEFTTPITPWLPG